MTRYSRTDYQVIVKAFRRSGLSLSKAASDALLKFVEQYNEPNINGFVEEVLIKLRTHSSSVTEKHVVTEELIRPLLQDLDQANDTQMAVNDDEIGIVTPKTKDISVIDAFEYVRALSHRSNNAPVLHAEATVKHHRLLTRGKMLLQRTKRDPVFCPPANHEIITKQNEYFELTALSSVMGTSGLQTVFGLLSEIEDGQFYLEDDDVVLPIDLSNCTISEGIFVDECFVLAQGIVDNNHFSVRMLGFPVHESRQRTLYLFPKLHFIPQHERKAVDNRLEENASCDDFLVFSDVHLDDERVLRKLSALFASTAAHVPRMIVLIGNFSSTNIGNDIKQHNLLFARLADIILQHPTIAVNSKFVLVPGPTDIGFGGVLPRRAIPQLATETLRQRLAAEHVSIVFTSNPCRIRYYTREIVIFRHDHLAKLRQNAVFEPLHETKLSDHLVKTVLEQAHLSPLPLQVQPIYWDFDEAMRLFPTPSALILADATDPFKTVFEGCLAFNPGSFAGDDEYAFFRPGFDDVKLITFEPA